MTTLTAAGRTRKAWSVKVKGFSAECRYTATASKARAETIRALMDAWGCTWAEAIAEIEYCLRWPASDITLPDRHPLAPQLPQEILHCVVHAYGGTGKKSGYRSHYYTSINDWHLRAAMYHGLFKVHASDRDGTHDYIAYVLTDLGRNVAAGEVETYPSH